MSIKGTRLPLKEKFVQIYESILLEGDEPWKTNDNFWDELFLLKVNVDYIVREFDSMKPEKLLQLKPVLNRVFSECVSALLRSDIRLRIVHAYQTLAAFVQGVYSKARTLDLGIDGLDLLVGVDVAENVMKDLLEISVSLLEVAIPHSLKLLVLKFLLAAETVSSNTLVEYLMMTSLFEPLLAILADGPSRQQCGYHAVLLLMLVVNYRKYESTNPYIMRLSIADNELALNGFGQVVSSTLADSNRHFLATNGGLSGASDSLPAGGKRSTTTSASSGGRGLLAGLLPTWLGGTPALQIEEQVDPRALAHEIAGGNIRSDAALLAMYEAVHLNRNFLAILTNTQAESLEIRPHRLQSPSSSAPSSPSSPTGPSLHLNPASNGSLDSSKSKLGGGEPLPLDADLLEPPTNLFVTFIEFTSIVMQNTKDGTSLNTTRLCFIILTCIAEDQYANSIMHDVNMQYKVFIQHAPMRHRKLPSSRDAPFRPLAAAVLDLQVEFILSHMIKNNFHIDLYIRSLGIVHRLLCYQKRCRVRLSYPWKDLWTSLISLLKFILANEVNLAKRGHNVFAVCSLVVNVINLFITYGDTFLATPSSYDELYYEIIRCSEVFENLYSTALRYTSGDGTPAGISPAGSNATTTSSSFTSSAVSPWRDPAARLASHLVNIRAIVNHFTAKINAWATAHCLASLTEEQVLDVVRSNYDSLTLKLHDNLDQFERYSEKPRESPFFTAMLRHLVSDVRKHLDYADRAQQNVLAEFATIR
ncbi:UPF0668 protein C10orf76 homolog isoform X2 [Varroa jacobsoni]|uniref:UPF0668 protein C10orf76 homolog isoform X2 n=1 Tax=Varroa jacobsoni TaxID=62625 RepID=UPI000BF4D7EA|nr:UPF0668 protein C10orf76 homolog isoform X2 [Varroa jacobsoni]